jgi:hypothetical protein
MQVSGPTNGPGSVFTVHYPINVYPPFTIQDYHVDSTNAQYHSPQLTAHFVAKQNIRAGTNSSSSRLANTRTADIDHIRKTPTP